MSEQITVKLPDGSTREYASGSTPAEVAASIGKGLAKAAIAAKADGEWVDLSRALDHHGSGFRSSHRKLASSETNYLAAASGAVLGRTEISTLDGKAFER